MRDDTLMQNVSVTQTQTLLFKQRLELSYFKLLSVCYVL